MGRPSLRQRVATWVWNARFNVAAAILPGTHRHISVSGRGDTCPRCGAVA